MINLPKIESIYLKNALDKVKDKYDFIIIDCSPSLGLITVNSLTAADSVLIPVQSEFFALEGLGKLLNTLSKLYKDGIKSRFRY
jgi:chromosome partitioning protein